MAKMKKEQQQVVMLSAVLVIIAGVLVYFYWDKIVPRPEGTEELTPVNRLAIPPADDKAFYDRHDFRSLKPFGDVPLHAMAGSGSPDPFQNDQQH